MLLMCCSGLLDYGSDSDSDEQAVQGSSVVSKPAQVQETILRDGYGVPVMAAAGYYQADDAGDTGKGSPPPPAPAPPAHVQRSYRHGRAASRSSSPEEPPQSPPKKAKHSSSPANISSR